MDSLSTAFIFRNETLVKLSTLINIARNEYLKDNKHPYRYSDTYLAQCFTLAEAEATRRTNAIYDKTTLVDSNNSPLCSLNVTSNVSTYALSPKILKIDKCYLNSDKKPLQQKTTEWLDSFIYSWRKDTGTPLYYIENKGQITLVPTPDTTLNNNTGADVLKLEVFRLPLKDLTLQGSNGVESEPEIAEEYHIGLIDYVCHLVYSKEPSDLNKSAFFETKFTRKFGLPISAIAEINARALPNVLKFSCPKF